MSDQDAAANATTAAVQPIEGLWSGYLEQVQAATSELLASSASCPDIAAWRREWFGTLSRMTDEWFRGPLFLQSLKGFIDALIAAGQTTHQPQGRVEVLADRLNELEQAVLLQVEDLERQIGAQRAANVGREMGSLWEQFLRVLERPRAQRDVMPGATSHDVVYERGSLKVLRYRNPVVTCAEPVLICYALVNRPYILDLQGDRSVVRRLLERGLDVYLIDWGVPSDADRHLRLEDYICRSMRDVAEFVSEHAGVSQLNLLGYCMGGTMSAMFTTLFPERVRNLILMATPIDFASDEALLGLWSRREYFDVDSLIDTFGNCPGEFLRYCFQLMKPVQNLAEKYVTFCEKLDDQAFLENFLAMERWSNDSIPVAGETFREFVKALYQENRLVKGEMSLGGVPVRLEAITCPLLLLVAEHDHLVPPASTLALASQAASADIETLSINAGHVGLAVSSRAHRQLWPAAAEWIVKHSTNRTSPSVDTQCVNPSDQARGGR